MQTTVSSGTALCECVRGKRGDSCSGLAVSTRQSERVVTSDESDLDLSIGFICGKGVEKPCKLFKNLVATHIHVQQYVSLTRTEVITLCVQYNM